MKKTLSLSLIMLNALAFSQTVSATYKIEDLLKRTAAKDTVYVLNFWATWCKPCVQELPAFDSLTTLNKQSNTKVLLVCLDFSEELQTKVIPFLKKKNIQSECVLLDEVNGNDYINKISESWTGAIPATCFQSGSKKVFVEKKMHLNELKNHLKQLQEP